METIRIVFYHTKDILKGRGIRVYSTLFVVSMLVMLYMEVMQLSMEVEGTLYMVASVLASIVNIVINYIVLFIFMKAVKKESMTMEDICYGLMKTPIFIVMGLLLSLLQIVLLSVCTLTSGIYVLYLFLYMFIYTIFVVWNALIAYSVYIGASFRDVMSCGPRFMKDHALEIMAACVVFLMWKLFSQVTMPYIIQALLGNTLYAGLIIPSIIKATSLSIPVLLMSLLVNVLYYAIQYACLLPIYTYIAKIFYEERKTYTRYSILRECNEKSEDNDTTRTIS